ncbi:MAG: cupin domain-containing protein [Nitrospirae bacterium]|nr:cupin domain-containing protein [Nitrospirota bacterium]MBI3352091.1 cupin domain-containing protein [Nitrospirota bacterium]
MTKRDRAATYPNGVQLVKWAAKEEPTPETVAVEMKRFGYKVYDLQTIAPWFERSRHAHDEPEIRAAVSGVITFHFDEFPVTIEAGDILLIPGGIAHEVMSHNARPFSAYKGSPSGERKVTEHGDGKGSVENLASKTAPGPKG